MTEYAIRLTDVNGKKTIIKPEHTTVIAAGTIAMPSGLNDDNTYGIDINLPSSNIPEADLGVIVIPHSPTKNVIYTRYLDGSSNVIYTTHYADSASTYYTRNESTGVMTAWSAGNRTASDKDTWNPILSCYPIAFWDKMGASTFSKIRLFAATAYCVRDTHDDINHSLDATPVGSGDTPTSINDDDIETYYYSRGLAKDQDELDVGYWAYVEFAAPKTITKVELVHTLELINWWVYQNDMYITLALYIDGSWYDIWQLYAAAPVSLTDRTDYIQGCWKNVSRVRVTYAGVIRGADPNPYNNAGWQTQATRELRAWGENYTDSDENTLVYSIGSNQIVDYLVTMRKYNY